MGLQPRDLATAGCGPGLADRGAMRTRWLVGWSLLLIAACGVEDYVDDPADDEWLDGKADSASAVDVKATNLDVDLAAKTAVATIGLEKAGNVELEAAGQLNEYVDLVVGFTALKLEDEQGAEIYTWVPRRTANMVLSSRIPGFDQLHLGLNGRWQSDIWTVDGTNGGVVRQVSYATLNLFAGWDITENANVRVNANNITDEKYIGSLYQVGFYAAPANYTVTFGYKF